MENLSTATKFQLEFLLSKVQTNFVVAMRVFAVVLFGVIATTAAFAEETAAVENNLDLSAFDAAIQCVNSSISNLEIVKKGFKVDPRTKKIFENIMKAVKKQSEVKLQQELGEDFVAEVQSATQTREASAKALESEMIKLAKEATSQDQIDEATVKITELCTRITDNKGELDKILNQIAEDIRVASREITKHLVISMIKNDPEAALTVDENMSALMSSIGEKISLASAAVMDIIYPTSEKKIE